MESEAFVAALGAQAGTEFTRLSLSNHVVDMEVGVYASEQGVKQRIRFDIDLYLPGASHPDEDEIDRVLDYDFIKSEIDRKVSSERVNLLESLVADLIDCYFVPHEVIAVSVTATKLDVYEGSAEVGCSMTKFRGIE